MKNYRVLECAAWCAVVSLMIFIVAMSLAKPTWPANWERVVFMAIAVCNLATIPPVVMSSSLNAPQFAATKPLLATAWRMLTLIGVIMVWYATKWLPSEFNAKCLLGCYFPFLLLESVLSIKHAQT
jgi:hypothetical protein